MCIDERSTRNVTIETKPIDDKCLFNRIQKETIEDIFNIVFEVIFVLSGKRSQ